MPLEERKLIVGIDIDNTLTWNLPTILRQAKEYCAEICHNYHFSSDIKSPSPGALFGFNKDQYDEFENRTCAENMRSIDPDDYCVEVMKRLYAKYTVIIITGRKNTGEVCKGYTGEQLEEDTKNWLNKHGIPYHGIAFNVDDKGAYCKKHNVDIMVDDNVGFIEQCIDNKIVTIVRGRPYNEIYRKDRRCIYASNFLEVEKFIDEYATHKYTAEAVMEAGSDIVKDSKFIPETPRINENTFFVSDIHLGKPNLGCGEDYYKVINKRVKEDDTIIFVGDIGFKKDEFRIQKLTDFFTKIKCKHMFLVLGNHDLDSIDKYYAMGFKGVFKKIITKKYVITHCPTRVKSGLINICGHIHGAGEYWGISQDARQINVFWKLIDGPRRLSELLEMEKKGLFKGDIKSEVKWETPLPSGPTLHLESTESRLMDPLGPSEMTFYHGSLTQVSCIKPISLNAGTKISSPRSSSFWTADQNGAVLFAVEGLINRECKNEEIERIPYAFDLKNVKLLVDKTRRSDFERITKKYPIYIYEKTMPMKYVGRGHNIGLHEYTIDIVVKPDKVHKLYFGNYDNIVFVDKSMIDKIIENHRTGNDMYSASLIEKLLYHDSNKTRELRKEIRGFSEDTDDLYTESNDDIIINFDKWQKRKNSNVIFITGLPASGKTTLSHELGIRHDAIVLELDAIMLGGGYPKGVYRPSEVNELYRKCPEYKYIKNCGKNIITQADFNEIKRRILKTLICICYSHQNTLYVIEGVQIFMYLGYNELDDKPLIVINRDYKTLNRRALTRAYKNGGIRGLLRELKELKSYYREYKIDFDRFKQRFDLVNEDGNNITLESEDKSVLDNDFEPLERYDLNQYKKISLNDPSIFKYIKNDKNWDEQRIKEMRNYGTKGYFYLNGNEIVAYVMVCDGYICPMRVYPKYQKHGLSNQILDYAIKHMGANKLHVYKDNEVALNLYKKFGFTNVGGNKDCYDMILKEDSGYIEESKMSTNERNNLGNDVFGVPSQRKYPLNDKDHVKAAIRMFNKVDSQYEKELAKNILNAMEKFNISTSVIGEKNRLYSYIKESDESMSIFTNPDMLTESVSKFINDKGKPVPHKCLKCGSDVKVYLRGEPVYLCSNPQCSKYYGVVMPTSSMMESTGSPKVPYDKMISEFTNCRNEKEIQRYLENNQEKFGSLKLFKSEFDKYVGRQSPNNRKKYTIHQIKIDKIINNSDDLNEYDTGFNPDNPESLEDILYRSTHLISTPEKVFDYAKDRIHYGNDGSNPKIQSAEQTFDLCSGNCHDQAVLNKKLLSRWAKRKNVRIKILFAATYKSENGNTICGMTHSILYYKYAGKYVWFETAWKGNQDTHKYNTLQQLKDDFKTRFLNLPANKGMNIDIVDATGKYEHVKDLNELNLATSKASGGGVSN